MDTIKRNPFLDALSAAGPDPAHAEALQLYGRFVGSWIVEQTDRFPDGSVDHNVGEWHFGWVLQGRAIQDVWTVPPSPRFSQNPPAGYPLRYGTTLRMYLPESDTWRITWTDPAVGYWSTMIGRAAGKDIVQEGHRVDGAPIRWSFRDIRPDSFRWFGEISQDKGASWFQEVEMLVRRR